MTYADAAKLCKFGAAVRNRHGGRPEYVLAEALNELPHVVRRRAQTFKRVRPRHWRPVFASYAGIYADWEPAFPKDVITMLAELADEPVVFGLWR